MRIFGVVQGVGYRASTRAKARALGVVGWVRNCPDGSVEVLAEGSETQLDALEAYCHHGPPDARVDSIESARGEASGEHVEFAVRR